MYQAQYWYHRAAKQNKTSKSNARRWWSSRWLLLSQRVYSAGAAAPHTMAATLLHEWSIVSFKTNGTLFFDECPSDRLFDYCIPFLTVFQISIGNHYAVHILACRLLEWHRGGFCSVASVWLGHHCTLRSAQIFLDHHAHQHRITKAAVWNPPDNWLYCYRHAFLLYEWTVQSRGRSCTDFDNMIRTVSQTILLLSICKSNYLFC